MATSGKTIDGREISETEISQMAKNYNQEEYTSNIWYEHIRYFGNLGQVVDVKAEKDDKDRLCLFTKLSPSIELMDLNSRGQKIFTSVEIQPNFCDTGEAYLVGLAVTDEPASVGTTQLHFSKRTQDDGNYFTPLEDAGTLTFARKDSLLAQVVDKFKSHSTKEQDNDDMSAELLQKISTTLTEQSQLLEKFSTRLDVLTVDDKKPDTKDDTQTSDTSDAPSKSEFNALKASFDDVSKQLSDLTKKFSSALTDQSDSTDLGDGLGGGEIQEYI